MQGKKLAQIWRHERGGDSELDSCLIAWVRRTQKAVAKSARFGVHFTHMYSFPAFREPQVETECVCTVSRG